MVRKLFKHEFISYYRVLPIVWIGLLALAAFARFVLFFEQDSTIYKIINFSSFLAYGIGLFLSLFAPIALTVVRFHKNLFTGEGYLSFTLPVTPFQHISVKLITSVVLEAITIIVVLISGAIITLGDVLKEILKAAGYLLEQLHLIAPELSGNLPFYILEFILFLIVTYATGVLLYYACISIGQLSKKNRILAAVGVYFAYYFICQIIETVIVIMIYLVNDWSWLLNWLEGFVENNPYLFIHLLILVATLFSAVLGIVYFAVTHGIVRKKLNLE